MQITINTEKNKETLSESNYKTFVVDKLNDGLPIRNTPFLKVGDECSTIQIPNHSNSDYDMVFVSFLLIARDYIYISWGGKDNYFNLKAYNEASWKKIWELIENIDFKNIQVNIN